MSGLRKPRGKHDSERLGSYRSWNHPFPESEKPVVHSKTERGLLLNSKEEPTESTFDELLDHLEASLMEVRPSLLSFCVEEFCEWIARQLVARFQTRTVLVGKPPVHVWCPPVSHLLGRQVELSQHHAVLLKRAELHLLTLLGGLRDLLMRRFGWVAAEKWGYQSERKRERERYVCMKLFLDNIFLYI